MRILAYQSQGKGKAILLQVNMEVSYVRQTALFSMTSSERHEISVALHVQVFSLGVGRTVISPMHVGTHIKTVLPLDSENGFS